MRVRSPLALGLVALALLLVVTALSTGLGSTGFYPVGDTVRAVGAWLGLGEPLAGHRQQIVEWRLYRTLTTVGVGAALALSGGLLQGVFRNDLASPSILGISAGASLGAAVAILTLGGHGPLAGAEGLASIAPLAVCTAAFWGAILVTFLVTTLASEGGRVSVPMLLLLGIAFNALASGLLLAIQSFLLRDFEVSRALLAWSFGTLDDRQGWHAGLVLGAVALAALAIPFIAVELDLFAAGEDDAQALGVNTSRVKVVAILASSLAAAVAVAVAGQIAFVGLVVPHLLRLLCGRSHRSLLPLCLVGGPLFLLGTDFLQRWLLGDLHLQPGILMSLVGGPFFVVLLLRNRASIQAW